jgi:hypothetical protein
VSSNPCPIDVATHLRPNAFCQHPRWISTPDGQRFLALPLLQLSSTSLQTPRGTIPFKTTAVIGTIMWLLAVIIKAFGMPPFKGVRELI